MNCERLKIIVRGAVQGVGFRPFVYRLATELELNGWVSNSAQGVFIEVEGGRDLLPKFLLLLDKEKTPHTVVSNPQSSPPLCSCTGQFSVSKRTNRRARSFKASSHPSLMQLAMADSKSGRARIAATKRR